MRSLQEIYEAAQSLPVDERAWLIHALWDTMGPKDWPPPSEEWMAEIQRRSEQLDRGQLTVAPWAEIRDRARRQAGIDG